MTICLVLRLVAGGFQRRFGARGHIMRVDKAVGEVLVAANGNAQSGGYGNLVI